MSMVPAERLAEVLVEVADTLVDEFDLIEFLGMVAGRTTEIVRVQGAGILLADQHGRLQLMAASDGARQDAGAVPAPGRRGSVPRLLPARRAGHRRRSRGGRRPLAVLRAPGRRRRNPVGACSPAAAAPDRDRGAQPVRHRGRPPLTGGGPGRPGAGGHRHHRAAAGTRHPPRRGARPAAPGGAEQPGGRRAGQGVLAQIHGVSMDDAFDMLRSYARSHRELLDRVAQAVTEDPSSLPELTGRPLT